MSGETGGSGRRPRSIALALIRQGHTWGVMRRRSNDAWHGLWEFPGGGIEASETAAEAAVREAAEETGLRVRALEELPPVYHDYGAFAVELHPVICQIIGEHQRVTELSWHTSEQLSALPMLPANAPVLHALAAYEARGASCE